MRYEKQVKKIIERGGYNKRSLNPTASLERFAEEVIELVLGKQSEDLNKFTDEQVDFKNRVQQEPVGEVRQKLGRKDTFIQLYRPLQVGDKLYSKSPVVGQDAPVIETCDFGHKFAKLADHPMRNNLPRCPHCLAVGLDRERARDLKDLTLEVEHKFEAPQSVEIKAVNKNLPSPNLLETAEKSGAVITGKPNGSEPISIVFSVGSWQEFDKRIAALINTLPTEDNAVNKLSNRDKIIKQCEAICEESARIHKENVRTKMALDSCARKIRCLMDVQDEEAELEDELNKGIFLRAKEHPVVLEIMADCADCIETEGSSMIGHEFDGSTLRAAAKSLREQASLIREEDPEIWGNCPVAGIASTAINETLLEPLKNVTANLTAAYSMLERGGKKSAESKVIFEMMLTDFLKSIKVGRDAVLTHQAKNKGIL